MIAHPDPAVLPELIDLVSAPYYHVRPSADVVGVEACAALKNLVVMAVGAVMGQLEIVGDAANGARMHNAAAAVFSQALGELEHLVHALGGRVETVLGLAGAGDLFVTCQGGRNGRMGRLLGRGLRYREARRPTCRTTRSRARSSRSPWGRPSPSGGPMGGSTPIPCLCRARYRRDLS